MIIAKINGQTPPTLKDFKEGALKDDRLGITCVVCHDPHKSTQEAQLRKSPQETCIQCHTAQLQGDVFKAGQEPHHAQQELFEGRGAIGVVKMPAKKLANCVDCHMRSVDKDGEPYVNHEFKVMVNDQLQTKHGPVEVSACAQCHRDMTRKEIEERAEAVKAKVEDLNKLLKIARAKLDNLKAIGIKADDAEQLYGEAFTNLHLIEAGKGEGIHNPDYTAEILKVTEQKIQQLLARLQ